jgi:hypothetical protein
MVLQHTITPISLEVLTMQNTKWCSSNLERIKWCCSTPLFLALSSIKLGEYKTVLQNQTFVIGNKKEQFVYTVLLYNRKLAQDLDGGKYLLFI